MRKGLTGRYSFLQEQERDMIDNMKEDDLASLISSDLLSSPAPGLDTNSKEKSSVISEKKTPATALVSTYKVPEAPKFQGAFFQSSSKFG
jgi:hypothetical protein